MPRQGTTTLREEQEGKDLVGGRNGEKRIKKRGTEKGPIKEVDRMRAQKKGCEYSIHEYCFLL